MSIPTQATTSPFESFSHILFPTSQKSPKNDQQKLDWLAEGFCAEGTQEPTLVISFGTRPKQYPCGLVGPHREQHQCVVETRDVGVVSQEWPCSQLCGINFMTHALSCLMATTSPYRWTSFPCSTTTVLSLTAASLAIHELMPVMQCMLYRMLKHADM